MYCILHVSKFLPPGKKHVFECWNESTSPSRIVFDDVSKRWLLHSSFEECGTTVKTRPESVTTETFDVSLFIREDYETNLSDSERIETLLPAEQKLVHAWYTAEHNEPHILSPETLTLESVKLGPPSLVVKMHLPPTEVFFLLRMYEPAPLRANPKYVKLNQSGDVAVTKHYLNTNASLPVFTSATEYTEEFRREEGKNQLERARVSVGYVSTPLDREGTVIPMEAEVKDLWRRWIVNEGLVTAFTRVKHLYSAQVQTMRDEHGEETWSNIASIPINIRVNGMLLFPKDAPSPSAPPHASSYSLREMAGLSSQATWYHHPTRPAVREGWIQERLLELLAARGWNLAKWVKIVKGMVQAGDTPGRKWTSDEHECISSYVRLVRMHSTTRQYNYDHIWDWKTKTNFDTDVWKSGLSAIEDCDGLSIATYAIAMTILFPPKNQWRSEEIRLLRQLAAIVGVPCGVTGTAVDAFSSHDEYGGHVFCTFIPFATFGAAVFPGKDMKVLKDRFQEVFGLPLPLSHTKPAICENIFFTTPFYSDHHGVSERKKQAAQTVRTWIGHREGKRLDWVKYASTHAMDKSVSSEGHAFRVFTDVLAQMFPPETVLPVNVAIVNRGEPTLLPKEDGIPRSFMLYQPHEYTKEDFDRLFPLYMEGVKVPSKVTLSTWRKWASGNVPDFLIDKVEKDFTRLRDRLLGSKGYGMPIELLAHGRPEFELHVTGTMPSSLVEKEQQIIRAYERPIVPLPPRAEDCFSERPDWITQVLSWKRLLFRRGVAVLSDAPSDPNRRIELYMYDITSQEEFLSGIYALYNDLHANGVCITKFGWCVVCIFQLPLI